VVADDDGGGGVMPKFLKPEEVVEPGYYWCKAYDGTPDIIEVFKYMGMVTGPRGCSLTMIADAFYGPLDEPWKAQP
jgi:hypothetical protein